MLTLEEAHYRLLHHRRYLEDFLHGKWERLDLSDVDLITLGAQDSRELVARATQIRRDVLHRAQGGFPSLCNAYPQTLARWVQLMPDDPDWVDLISMFLESRSFEKTLAGDPDVKPLTKVEAFFEFATRMACFPADVLEHEWIVVALQGLARTPHEHVAIHDIRLRPTLLGWQAVVDRPEGPFLYAIRDNQLITGTITPLLSALLHAEDDDAPRRLARKFGLSVHAVDSIVDRLIDLGLRATPQAAAAK